MLTECRLNIDKYPAPLVEMQAFIWPSVRGGFQEEAGFFGKKVREGEVLISQAFRAGKRGQGHARKIAKFKEAIAAGGALILQAIKEAAGNCSHEGRA